MNKFFFSSAFVLLLFLVNAAFGQSGSFHYQAELQAIGTSGGVVPFWMRSNQYGSIPLSGASSSFIGGAYKEYDSLKTAAGKARGFNWGGGFEGRVNAGSKTELILTEAYLKARLGPFELKAGRSKETMGLTGDTSLTSGSFAVSGNALGIPKVQISIPDYYTLPWFDSLFAFKGNFAHGWVGEVPITAKVVGTKPSDPPLITLEHNPLTYLHQKSFYGKFGKPGWRVKFIAGFNHQVTWGHERSFFGSDYKLSPLETFTYVATGRTYGSGKIPHSKIGNQLGSIDMGLEYDFDKVKLIAYRQNLYDVGALYYLANIRDGLHGLTLINKGRGAKNISWQKILFEFLYTKNQAGELWSKPTPSGDEDYYNNYFYIQGWSYQAIGLGTPFISSKISTRSGLASHPSDYFINNRVIAFHSGLAGKIHKWYYTGKLSYSVNYGTFGTSQAGHSTGKIRGTPQFGLFGSVRQFSAFLEGSRMLKNGFRFSYVAAIDRGGLLYNSEGIVLKVIKSFR